MITWTKYLLSEYSKKNPVIIQMLKTDTLNNREAVPYAYGLMKRENGCYWHDGVFQGFRNISIFYPEQNVGGFKNFSLYFPDSTFDMSLYLKRRMVLSFTGDFCVKNKPEPIADGVYRALAWDTAYQAFERNTVKDLFVGKDGVKSRPDRAWHNLCENTYSGYAGEKLCSTKTRLFALAPINSRTAGANYANALSWGVSRLGIDQYGADDYTDLSIARYTSRAASSNALTGKTGVLPK
jgi:hypothetical protein